MRFRGGMWKYPFSVKQCAKQCAHNQNLRRAKFENFRFSILRRISNLRRARINNHQPENSKLTELLDIGMLGSCLTLQAYGYAGTINGSVRVGPISKSEIFNGQGPLSKRFFPEPCLKNAKSRFVERKNNRKVRSNI